MKRKLPLYLLLLPVVATNSCNTVNQEVYLEEGVSKLLATYRKSTVK